MTSKTTASTTLTQGCACAIPCQPTAPGKDATAGDQCHGPVPLHDPSVASVDNRGVTHLPSHAGDIAFWLRCGIEL